MTRYEREKAMQADDALRWLERAEDKLLLGLGKDRLSGERTVLSAFLSSVDPSIRHRTNVQYDRLTALLDT